MSNCPPGCRVNFNIFYLREKLPCYTHACRVASRFIWITSSRSTFAWFVDESAGKENVSYSRHRNTSFIERVTKQVLQCFSIYSLQLALPKMFTSRNVNNLVFASQLVISSKLQAYLDHLRLGSEGKYIFQESELCSVLFIAIGARFSVYAPECKQFHCTRRRVLNKLELHVSCS